MFEGSSGSIKQRGCTPNMIVPSQYVTRRSIPERELIVPTPSRISTLAIISAITYQGACPKCGTFEKSGRVSCCAPGGA